MGTHPNLDHERYPKQSENVGDYAWVTFNYDTERPIRALVVRDDREGPNRTILVLDDGRTVMSTECQFTFAPVGPSPMEPPPGTYLRHLGDFVRAKNTLGYPT